TAHKQEAHGTPMGIARKSAVRFLLF
ncbi:autotransporter beta-domain protein, partial [Chlamydia psittaci 02DC14]